MIASDIAALRDEDRMTPDLVFRDPYFLDFLGLTGSYVEKDMEHVELLQLDKSGIRIAQYLTELPPRELLEKTLHNSIRRARERLALTKQDVPAEALAGGTASKTKRRKPRKASKR